ncbi:MAG: 6-pyruvoyl tetrahydropterin synthase family protein [Candidatus Heimdallarchaeota archaeon]
MLTQNFSHPRNSFTASHFLIGYGKCDRLHGHNYAVQVQLQYHNTIVSDPIDFRIINGRIRTELQQLNQKILLPEESSAIQVSSTHNGKNWDVLVNEKMYSFPKQDVVILEGIDLTTAENLAQYIYLRLTNWFEQHFPRKIADIRVKVEENLGNQAIYSV